MNRLLTAARARPALSATVRAWGLRADERRDPRPFNRYDIAHILLVTVVAAHAMVTIVGYFQFGWSAPHLTPLGLILFSAIIGSGIALAHRSRKVSRAAIEN